MALFGMTTAVVLQPSFVPWRGYFDLIRRADVFVFYDDVQYDKHGWRNRNRIKTASGPRWLTIPVHAAGNTVDGLPIREVRIDWSRDWRRAHVEQLRHAYARAPFYRDHAAFVDELYAAKPELLADFTIETTIALAKVLGLDGTHFVRSSQLGACGAKTDRLLQVLSKTGATRYISGPSARAYIEEEKFRDAGIALEYITYDYQPYPQLHPPYDANVSILDLLFMTGPQASSFIRPATQAVA